MFDLNAKIVTLLVASLLTVTPASVAAPTLQASAHCAAGQLVGVTVSVTVPGTHTIFFKGNVCSRSYGALT